MSGRMPSSTEPLGDRSVYAEGPRARECRIVDLRWWNAGGMGGMTVGEGGVGVEVQVGGMMQQGRRKGSVVMDFVEKEISDR